MNVNSHWLWAFAYVAMWAIYAASKQGLLGAFAVGVTVAVGVFFGYLAGSNGGDR